MTLLLPLIAVGVFAALYVAVYLARKTKALPPSFMGQALAAKDEKPWTPKEREDLLWAMARLLPESAMHGRVWDGNDLLIGDVRFRRTTDVYPYKVRATIDGENWKVVTSFATVGALYEELLKG